MQHLLEPLPILGPVNGIRGGADDRHPGLFQGHGQLKRGLTTELDDNAIGLFFSHDLQHILQSQRLEVEPVGGIVIGGDGLRVAVDHDGLIAVLSQGEDAMYTAVIELDPLADPVGTAAQDNNLLAITDLGLALLLVGGIEVGGMGHKFGGAGINPLVNRADSEFPAQFPHRIFAGLPQLGQHLVGEAVLLGLKKNGLQLFLSLKLDLNLLKLFFFCNDLAEIMHKPGVKGGMPKDLFHAHAAAQGIGQVPDPLGIGGLQFFQQQPLFLLG